MRGFRNEFQREEIRQEANTSTARYDSFHFSRSEVFQR